MYSGTRFWMLVHEARMHRRHQEHRQHDQHQRDAVDPEVPRQERREQVDLLNELEGGGRGVEGQPQDDTEGEFNEGRPEGDATRRRRARLVVARPDEDRRGSDEGEEDEDREDGDHLRSSPLAGRGTIALAMVEGGWIERPPLPVTAPLHHALKKRAVPLPVPGRIEFAALTTKTSAARTMSPPPRRRSASSAHKCRDTPTGTASRAPPCRRRRASPRRGRSGR